MFASIVIPTCNHLSDCLRPCMESIFKYTDLSDTEIIVVANGCTYDTLGYLEECQKISSSIQYIWLEEKSGFTKSVNVGIKAARGDYIVLLNNDTFLEEQEQNAWIDILHAPFQDSSVGVTGPIKFKWSSGNNEYEAIAFWCAMIRASVFNKIGVLDEIFNPGCGDDADFCNRAIAAGYILVQVPEQREARSLADYSDRSAFPIHHEYCVTVTDDLYNKYRYLDRNSKILYNRYGGLQNNDTAPRDSLEEIYSGCCINMCDLNEHFPTLRALAESCDHVTEFGVREVFSTYALLAARPKTLISYDLLTSQEICHPYNLAVAHNLDFRFIEGNTLEVVIDSTDMLFIDTKHTYEQLSQELKLHAHKVSKYIVLHDTETFKDKGEDGTDGLWPAVVEFLKNNREWSMMAHYTHNNGLTVLKRNKVPSYARRIDLQNICFSE